jgi:hypothetical protein
MESRGGSAHAGDFAILRNRHCDVLQRPFSASFSRSLRQRASTRRDLFKTFRADLFSVAAAFVVTALAGLKLHAIRARMPDKIPSWRALRDEAIRSPTIDPGAGKGIPWASADAVAAALRRQERMNRGAAPLLVTAGAGLMFLAFHLEVTTHDFLAHAVPATGHVVDLAASVSGDGTTYAAMVEFEASGGRHRFKDSLAANSPVYRAGDEVPIRYLPEDPGVARIDRGIWSRLLPAGVGLFGALLALTGLILGARLLLQARTATA